MRKLLRVDPFTGTAQYVEYDENDDTFRFTQEIEAEPITEWNKKLYNEAPTSWGDGASVARIPLALWFTLKQAGILDDKKALRRWINDPENRHFRLRPGDV